MKEKPIKQEWKFRHWDDEMTDTECVSLVLLCACLIYLVLSL